ncbi:MAG: LEA type 2 family protein [Fibrobacteria bacterium]|nr:LEA type 2 family protein [Fibrobacteria bacterium]
MEMRISNFFLFSFLAFCLSGCVALQDVLKTTSVQPPQGTLSKLRLNVLDSYISGNLEVSNPNAFDLPMPKFSVDISLSGKAIGKAYNEFSGTIKGNNKVDIPIRINVDFFTSIISQLSSFVVTQRGNVKYTIELGNFYLALESPWELTSGKATIKKPDFGTMKFLQK